MATENVAGAAVSSSYHKAWLAWGTAFVAIEGSAFASGRRDQTLSAHTWRAFKVKDKESHPALRWGLRGLLAAFMTWLWLHLNFGILSL